MVLGASQRCNKGIQYGYSSNYENPMKTYENPKFLPTMSKLNTLNCVLLNMVELFRNVLPHKLTNIPSMEDHPQHSRHLHCNEVGIHVKATMVVQQGIANQVRLGSWRWHPPLSIRMDTQFMAVLEKQIGYES